MAVDFTGEFDQFMRELNAAVHDTLEAEVADQARETMQNMVWSYVYDAYTPKMYQRRYALGGLGDMQHYVAEVTGGGNEHILTVSNHAPFKDLSSDGEKDLSDVVETGDKKYRMPFARPFVREAERNFVRTKDAERALMLGLKLRGFIDEKK